MKATELVNRAWDAGLKPPPDLTVWEWAEENRVLGASSPAPGPYRTDKTPYLRQIMECLSPSSQTREIDFMKGSQVGGTEASINWIGYIVSEGLGNTLIVLPDMKAAKEWSQQRLEQLTDTTPCLRGKLVESAKRNAKNSTFSKRFGGGQFLKFAWASSPSTMKSTPAANLIADEVDEFVGDSKGQGDPIAMLRRRFTNFERGKFFRVSTPTAERGSRIERGFNEGDQRYYFVPCPDCSYFQRLVFGQVDFKGSGRGAAYRCLSCEVLIEERFKTQMLAAGKWLATADRPTFAKDGFPASSLPGLAPAFAKMLAERHATFHLSAYYSPLGWYSWSDAARDWQQAKGDTKALKVQVNQTMGETWQDRGESAEWETLYSRRHQAYEPGISPVPSAGLFLTSGWDIQADRIEGEVVAWGRNWRSWSVDYKVFRGRTDTDAPWLELEEYLKTEFVHSIHGRLQILCSAIDSGYNSGMVYKFARRHPQLAYGPSGATVTQSRTVMVTKGGFSLDKIIETVSSEDAAKKNRGLRIYLLGTRKLKQELSDWLKATAFEADGVVTYPEGYSEFPNHEPSYFQGLCAEARVITAAGRIEWVHDKKFRNEPLDCRLGARAAAEVYAGRFREAQWSAMERRFAELQARENELARPVPATATTGEMATESQAAPQTRSRVFGKFRI